VLPIQARVIQKLDGDMLSAAASDAPDQTNICKRSNTICAMPASYKKQKQTEEMKELDATSEEDLNRACNNFNLVPN